MRQARQVPDPGTCRNSALIDIVDERLASKNVQAEWERASPNGC
jgi:hypothetical protein